MMTDRERLLAILDGRSPDRVPWIPRLQLWYNARLTEGNMPQRFRGMTLREIECALRLGDPARGGRVFRARLEGVEVATHRRGGEEVVEYRTPVGTVTRRRVRSQALEGYTDSPLDVEFVIKGPQDYDVWEYVVEHTYYDPAYEEYLAYDAQVGDRGLPMVSAGDCPFHEFLQTLAGYERAYYELADRLPRVERLLQVMTDVDRERLWPVVAQSPARLILHGVHFDSQMTPPRFFDQYMTPYYRELSALLHAHGKALAFHADDDTKMILSQVQDAGFDMAECFTTAPMVSCTLRDARQAWGTDVIIWGGVPSVILEPEVPEAEFEAYMLDVFRAIAPGDAVILGVADNVMPRALIERIERISQMVEEYGRYPVTVPEAGGAH